MTALGLAPPSSQFQARHLDVPLGLPPAWPTQQEDNHPPPPACGGGGQLPMSSRTLPSSAIGPASSITPAPKAQA
jgi:hypothetical protein